MVCAVAGRNANTKLTNKMTLPSSLTEIRKAAESMFLDPAVISVQVRATFGIVTVFRDGTITMA
jgi:hypothetical protein